MPIVPKQTIQLKASNTRLLIAISALIIALIGYFIINDFYRSIQNAKEEVLHQLMAITQTASLFIDGDAHQRIASQYMEKDQLLLYEQDEAYLQLHLQLLKIKEINQLATPLYTIVYYSPDSTFHFIGTSAEKPYFRHRYKNYPKNLLKQQQTGGVLDTYEDENGKWLSAFAPIKNKKGEVVGLVEADENFEWFIEQARSELIGNALLSLLLIIPFGLLLFNYVARTLGRQALDQEKLVHQKEEIEAQNEEIKTQNDFIEKQNKDLENRVKKRTIDLEKTNAELSNFLYHSSHDVQAPIATLKGLYILAQRETKDVVILSYLKLMLQTTYTLDRMLKTIQLVHQIRTSTISPTSIALKNFVCTIAEQLLPIDEPINFTCEINSDFVLISDQLLIHNVFYELIKNAIQYRKRSEELPSIKIYCVQDSNALQIFIDDNGDGIPEESRLDIFRMFKRSNEKSSGIGLGLYIVNCCLERLGGTLQLIDKAERGVRFLIRLKLDEKLIEIRGAAETS